MRVTWREMATAKNQVETTEKKNHGKSSAISGTFK